MLVKACLNGNRSPEDHPAIPVTPEEIADDAAAAVEAGAGAVHVHPRADDGRETLDAEWCDAVVAAVREACPGTPVGLTTGAWIEPRPERRLGLVRSWSVRPDFVSVNLSEPGASELCIALRELGIGVELGVWRPDEVAIMRRDRLADGCLRVLVEALDEDPAQALATANAIHADLDDVGVDAPRLQHGMDMSTWPVLRDAVARGLDVRIGFEDTLVLPDDSTAMDNADLVAAAVELVNRTGRS